MIEICRRVISCLLKIQECLWERSQPKSPPSRQRPFWERRSEELRYQCSLKRTSVCVKRVIPMSACLTGNFRGKGDYNRKQQIWRTYCGLLWEVFKLKPPYCSESPLPTLRGHLRVISSPSHFPSLHRENQLLLPAILAQNNLGKRLLFANFRINVCEWS